MKNKIMKMMGMLAVLTVFTGCPITIPIPPIQWPTNSPPVITNTPPVDPPVITNTPPVTGLWGGKTAFLLKGKAGSKYTNAQGRSSTLTLINDGDRTAMNEQRLYVADYLKNIGADVCPSIICNDDGKDGTCTPFKSGWGGEINGDYCAWMFYCDNDRAMFGSILNVRGIRMVPILFCSEDQGGKFSDPSWAEQMIKDMTPFWTVHGNVNMICIALEAEKFMTPSVVNKIAGHIRKYMPGVKIIVHCTNTSYANCNVDAVAVQANWHPKDGDAHSPAEVAALVKQYKDAGAKEVIVAEYNWNSEGDKAKAQGSAAIAAGARGVWCGW